MAKEQKRIKKSQMATAPGEASLTLEKLIEDLKTRNSHYYKRNRVKDNDIAKDAAIIAGRIAALDSIPGIRVGDFLRLKNGQPTQRGHDRVINGDLARVAHDWGDSVQPSAERGPCARSFYLDDGEVSHSGGLESAIPITDFTRTGESVYGLIWIFHLDVMGGGRAVRAMIPFRVYEQFSSGDNP